MSPEAQQILDDLKSHMDLAFERLVEIAQADAAQQLITRLTGVTSAPVAQVEKPTPKRGLQATKLTGDRLAQFKALNMKRGSQTPASPEEAKTEPAPKHYANPEDDPNYGQKGSECYMEKLDTPMAVPMDGGDE